jgi:hypothetical protein
MNNALRFAPILLLVALPAGSASAVTVRVDPIDSGTLRNRTPSIVLVGPIYASMDDNVNDGRYRNYFKFDLSGVSGTVLSAYLSLEFPDGAYDSKEDAELYEVFEVTSDPDSFGFNFDDGSIRSFSADVWRDLGDGVRYGARRFSAADEGTTPRINLSDDAVAAINAAIASGGTFAVGGRLSPNTHAGFGAAAAVDSDYIFLETGSAETDLRFESFETERALVLDLGP